MSADFTFTIESEQLMRGLRSSKRVPRNAKYLVESTGAVGRDGVLAAIDELTRLDTSEITDIFPFPQLFVFTNVTIVCSSTKIYEWVDNALIEKLEVTAGSTWSAVDYYDYAYLSNGAVAVVRDYGTKLYSLTTDLSTANSILNFNGQVVIGSPDANAVGASLSFKADAFEITLSQHGEWS